MTVLRFLLVACLSLFMFNCGGDEKKEDKEAVKIQARSPESNKVEDASTANLVISGNDLMQFDKSELRAKAGQKVKLTLRHIGKLDKQVMGHNVVILKMATNPEDFAAAAATARENDYIPEDSDDQMIAHTEMIGGGQTTSIEFTAPTEPGEYEFLCSFPGHFQMMRGKFIVE